jgi:tetratricopeptide (TPR) repeat protein
LHEARLCYYYYYKMKRKAISLICFLFLLGSAAQAQTAGSFPSLEPDRLAEAYARREAPDWEDFAEIGLWASASEGAGQAVPAGNGAHLDRLRDAVRELRSSPELPQNLRDRGEYILTWMHQKFLKSYSLQQTRLDTLLAGGRYNCVSSAVLYLILGSSAGLEIRGVMTKDHAFAAVRAGGEWIDVETTNPYGFDPGNRKEFHDQFGKVTGFAYVPVRNYRDQAVISPIELVSLIFSNRIAELERRSRFAEAVPLAISRAGLLLGGGTSGGAASGDSRAPADGVEPAPFFEDPRQDLMNRILNFGAFLLKGGREEDALRWAVLAGTQYPDEERWQEFTFAAANNRMIRQIRAGRLSEARTSLDLLAPVLSAANFNRLDTVLTDTELMNRASGIKNTGEAAAFIAAIDRAEGRTILPSGRAEELRVFAIEKAASLLTAARDWTGAIAWLEEALDRYGPSPRLEQTLRSCRSNLAVDYHNRFAAAWNRRNYGEAEQILEEGLGLFPDNRQLLADQATAARAGR